MFLLKIMALRSILSIFVKTTIILTKGMERKGNVKGHRNIILISIVMILLQFEAKSQENIYTDRPTQTTSSAIVPVGAFQIETGFYLSEFTNTNMTGATDKLQFYSLNNLLLRYGVSDRFELRFNHEISKVRQVIDGSVAFSNSPIFAPTSFGFKYNISKGNSKLPDIGIVTSFGGGIFEETGNGLQSEIRLAIDGNLTDELTISSNLGISLANKFESAIPLYTLVLGHGINDRLGVFVEAYGSFPEGGANTHAMDAGLTFLVNSSLQLDVYGGTGISSNSANLLIGFGLSKRFFK